MRNNMEPTQRIGNRFEVLNFLSQGGMGAVYRGKDTQTGELVAIKVLKSDVVQNDPGILARFEREGELLRTLNHPNIVKLLATGQEADQQYLVMELVSGGSLADLLAKQPQLPVSQVMAMALEI